MENKTCGDCQYFARTNNYDMCVMYADFRDESDCRQCEYFTQKVITNGDVIQQGGNRALAEFIDKVWKCPCEFCIYAKYIEDFGFGEGGFDCKKPDEKDCTDGFEAWLNAPAESEGEDA